MEDNNQKQTLTHTIAVRLSEDENDIFERICNRLNKNKSTFLRAMIYQLNENLIDDIDED